MSPEDVTDEMLIAAKLVRRPALRPKKCKYAERDRIAALQQARITYCRRNARTDEQMVYVDPHRLSEMHAYFEAVHGQGISAQDLKAMIDGVGDIAFLVTLWRSKLESYIEDKRSTREALDHETCHSRRRRLRQMLATPKWFDMEEVAKLILRRDFLTRETGIVHHIDHVFPLAAKLVCGLHVHHNMRVVPAKQNLQKGARMTREALDKEAAEMQTAHI